MWGPSSKVRATVPGTVQLEIMVPTGTAAAGATPTAAAMFAATLALEGLGPLDIAPLLGCEVMPVPEGYGAAPVPEGYGGVTGLEWATKAQVPRR